MTGFGHNWTCTVKLSTWTKCVGIHWPNGKAPRALSYSHGRHENHRRYLIGIASMQPIESKKISERVATYLITTWCTRPLVAITTGSSGMMSTSKFFLSLFLENRAYLEQ
ncbi:unnamed protein product [Albugo candida]|uniref:Uncharacterized protein n=1 Tax=Albugo candida TaxID=65357 RepID=A0A024G8Z0_9STRA|nr:unnamed protein product [Albugo candida]|eukprot:CCI43139.1 unnamed protein product [Albugo candida]